MLKEAVKNFPGPGHCTSDRLHSGRLEPGPVRHRFQDAAAASCCNKFDI